MNETANKLREYEAARLALRPKEAAKSLGISERKLWSLTTEGKIPHARFGRAVRYPVKELEEWLSGQVQEGRSI
jgi:excisionase family DNA binding protein